MLTDTQVANLKKKDRDYTVADKTTAKGEGTLVLKVRTKGTKELYYRYYLYGRPKMMKLGNYPNTGLADARNKVVELSKLNDSQTDIKEVIKRKRQAEWRARSEEVKQGSLGQLIEAYLNSLKEQGKPSYYDTEYSFRKHLFEPWRDLTRKPAKDITPADISAVMSAMLKKNNKAYAVLFQGRLSTAFKFGVHQDYNPLHNSEAPVQFGLTQNPVASLPTQRHFIRPRDRVLSKDELKQFWFSLSHDVSAKYAIFYRLNIALGCQRLIQLLGCEWSAFNFDERIVTIRNNKQRAQEAVNHVVPLNAVAIRLLQELRDVYTTAANGDEFVYPFPGHFYTPEKPLGRSAVQKFLCKHIKTFNLDHFEPRDLRRTWKTLAGELGIGTKLDRDRVQGHAMTDVSSRHYDRYEYLKEKRAILDQWGKWLEREVIPHANKPTLTGDN